MRFLDVTLDTYQDTSGYMYLGLLKSRYIKIHRDSKSRYMYLGRVMTTLQDTIRIHHDTSKIHNEIHVSQMYLERYVSEMWDTCRIHAEFWDILGV